MYVLVSNNLTNQINLFVCLLSNSNFLEDLNHRFCLRNYKHVSAKQILN